MTEPVTRYDGAVTERAEGDLMTGPKDRTAEHEQTPDSVRTRESDPIAAELRQRMERLPPGHPSSPYNGDGTRKPPVPDPFEHDYPIPGDPDFRADLPEAPQTGKDLTTPDGPMRGKTPGFERQCDAELPPEDKPWIGSDGSWEWKGRRLTPQESRGADQALTRYIEAEGRDAEGNYGEQGLTPAMRRIEAQLDDAHLADKTVDRALKSPDRVKEKLAREREKNPDKAVAELAFEMHDAIRYTFILEAEAYPSTYWEAQQKLESQGYELEVRRNMWAKLEYKGINSRWRDSNSGLPFEIQFHTQASWEAKQETHAAYEKIEDTRTPTAEREKLREYQKEVSARVQEPPGVMEIPDYRTKVQKT